MKTFYLTLLAFAQFAIAFAQEETKEIPKEEGITISVKIDNVKNNTGTVYFALHTEDTFMKAQGIQSAQSKIEGKEVNVTFTNVPKGEYAILAFHDENDNKKMDFTSIGMPAEDYATSAKGMSFGPPSFNGSKFTIDAEDKSLHLRF